VQEAHPDIVLVLTASSAAASVLQVACDCCNHDLATELSGELGEAWRITVAKVDSEAHEPEVPVAIGKSNRETLYDQSVGKFDSELPSARRRHVSRLAARSSA
jgi:pyocin large subunit-like protein